jgi:hypothetical protein
MGGPEFSTTRPPGVREPVTAEPRLRPRVTSELRRLGLGLPDFVCMRILSAFPGRSSAELARDTNVSPPAMNQ